MKGTLHELSNSDIVSRSAKLRLYRTNSYNTNNNELTEGKPKLSQ